MCSEKDDGKYALLHYSGLAGVDVEWSYKLCLALSTSAVCC